MGRIRQATSWIARNGMHCAFVLSLLVFAVFSLNALTGCQTGPKPGEATITGGKAQASRSEDDGWEIVIEKAAPPKPEPVEVTLEIMEAPR